MARSVSCAIAAIGVDAVIAPLLLEPIGGVIGVNLSVICVADKGHLGNMHRRPVLPRFSG